MSLSYYSRLRPYYSSEPEQRFRCLASALCEICDDVQQQVETFLELPLLEDKKQFVTSQGICQILTQSLEHIVNAVSTTEIAPDTVTEKQLHYLKFDLHTWVTSIRGCVTVLKHLIHQDMRRNHLQYVAALTPLEKAANDMRDVIEALYSPHERET